MQKRQKLAFNHNAAKWEKLDYYFATIEPDRTPIATSKNIQKQLHTAINHSENTVNRLNTSQCIDNRATVHNNKMQSIEPFTSTTESDCTVNAMKMRPSLSQTLQALAFITKSQFKTLVIVCINQRHKNPKTRPTSSIYMINYSTILWLSLLSQRTPNFAYNTDDLHTRIKVKHTLYLSNVQC